MNHADILWTLKEAPHVVKHYHFEHVKSHQDDKIAVEDLPFSAQLNVLCDDMATEHMKRQPTHVTEASISTALPSRSLPLEIFFGSQPISAHYIKTYGSKLAPKDIVANFKQSTSGVIKLQVPSWGYLATESLSLCSRRTTLDNAVNRSKLIHNWLNLGTQRGKVDRQSPPTARHCPYCAQQEDFRHLLSCADPRARLAQYKATLKLRKAIDGSPAAPTILRAVQLWTNTPSDEVDIPHGDSPFAPDISCAVATQYCIGRTNFFRGFLASNGDLFAPWMILRYRLPISTSEPSSTLPKLSGRSRITPWHSGIAGMQFFMPTLHPAAKFLRRP